MYEFLLAVHLLAAVMWVGGGVTMHLFGRRARSSGDVSRMLEFTRDANLLGPRFYAPLSIVLLVAGVLLVDEAGYEMSQTWISLAFLGWIVSFVVGVGFYGGQARKLEAAAAGGDQSAVVQIYDRVALVNLVEITILLLVVVDMAVKPGV